MIRKNSLFAFPLILAATAAGAQSTDWAQANRVEIGLANFKFVPATITLHHGQAYVLHFMNRASGGHNFVAKDFFARATIAPDDQKSVQRGEIELHRGDALDVRLVAPAAGTYEVHCSHLGHAALGMVGQIVVD